MVINYNLYWVVYNLCIYEFMEDGIELSTIRDHI